MPWHIETDNPQCAGGFAVVKDDDGDVVGCHETEQSAQDQLTALNIAESEDRGPYGVDLTVNAETQSAAAKGIRLHEDGKSGDGIVPATIRDAVRMARRDELSEDKVRRMPAWFARHEGDWTRGTDDQPGDETPGYTRLQLSGATYRAISENLVAAVRAEYGAFLGSNAVPPDKLFFAGGGGTVRGYEYQSLSPRDAFGILTGGRNLFTASAEMRWRASERFGYAVFADVGAAADDPGSAFSEASAAVGIGVRYYPGFGPVRLDVAAPLDKRDGDAPVQVYISIGQAF
jgi:hypothetical protein